MLILSSYLAIHKLEQLQYRLHSIQTKLHVSKELLNHKFKYTSVKLHKIQIVTNILSSHDVVAMAHSQLFNDVLSLPVFACQEWTQGLGYTVNHIIIGPPLSQSSPICMYWTEAL